MFHWDPYLQGSLRQKWSQCLVSERLEKMATVKPKRTSLLISHVKEKDEKEEETSKCSLYKLRNTCRLWQRIYKQTSIFSHQKLIIKILARLNNFKLCEQRDTLTPKYSDLTFLLVEGREVWLPVAINLLFLFLCQIQFTDRKATLCSWSENMKAIYFWWVDVAPGILTIFL